MLIKILSCLTLPISEKLKQTRIWVASSLVGARTRTRGLDNLPTKPASTSLRSF